MLQWYTGRKWRLTFSIAWKNALRFCLVIVPDDMIVSFSHLAVLKQELNKSINQSTERDSKFRHIDACCRTAASISWIIHVSYFFRSKTIFWRIFHIHNSANNTFGEPFFVAQVTGTIRAKTCRTRKRIITFPCIVFDVIWVKILPLIRSLAGEKIFSDTSVERCSMTLIAGKLILPRLRL